jgi:antitoxin HicB
MAKNKHIGSDFEDFLREDGILEEVDALVQKELIADQIRDAMRERSISEAALARAMKTSRTTVRSLLDPTSEAATLVTLTKAAQALGRELRITFVSGGSVAKKAAARKVPTKRAKKVSPKSLRAV